MKRDAAIAGIVPFDADEETAARREKRMAQTLLAAAAGLPGSLVIALTGNIHACKEKLPRIGDYPLMASLLPASETVSLFVADKGGESSTCQQDRCGPHALRSTGGAQREVRLAPKASPLPGYDGVLSTGQAASASRPAGR